MLKAIFQIIMVILIIIGAAMTFMFLKNSRKDPEKKAQEVVLPLLNVMAVGSEDIQVDVTGFGTVKPKAVVEVIPQVAGIVEDCHKNFVNGGFFRKGEMLITIDSRDYELAVKSAEAEVKNAEVIFELEESEASVAKREWQQMNEGEEPTSTLVLREPQINKAKAQLAAAEAKLEMAKLNLSRTIISMPFNGRIAGESVDVGQFVSVGKKLATVYGTDVAEIIMPIKDSELAWFDVPIGYANDDNTPAINGSSLEVVADFAGGNYRWQGRIVRTEANIDAASRMVNVVIEVEKPFARQGNRPPLTPGMFVKLEIKGKELKDVIKIPRYALHNTNEVWKANGESLHIVKVDVARREKDFVYLSAGLNAGDMVITSPLDTVTENMRIETVTVEQEDNK
jgi:RND family efflux transporter MFP subunit